jgi:glycosyltransferase involved in cell wall biosynthesis
MKDPLVSVIIPVYNSASTVVRSITSVLEQTFTHREIIVVDDGSTDNLLEVLSPYDVRIVRQSNSGASAARNHGCSIAKGEFLAFLDADDFWHPDKLRQQIYAMKKGPTARYCVTESCRVFSSNPNIKDFWPENKGYLQAEVINFPRVFESPYFGTPGVVMPKSIFESCGGFNENLITAEDVDLWLRAAYGGFVLKIPEILFCVVSNENSLSAKFLDRTFIDNIHVITQFCKSHPEFMESYKKAVNIANSRVYCDWGSAALTRGDIVLAKEKLTLSIKAKPTVRSLYLFSKALLSIK